MEWKLEGMENKEQNITYYISFIHIYDFFLYKKTNSLFQIMLLIIYILTQLILFVKLINKKRREQKIQL